MSEPGNEMETETVLNTPCSSPTLSCIAFCDKCLDEATDLSLFIKSKRCQVVIAQIYEKTSRYLISRCLPESITHVMSGIVIPVSAILVAGICMHEQNFFVCCSKGSPYQSRFSGFRGPEYQIPHFDFHLRESNEGDIS